MAGRVTAVTASEFCTMRLTVEKSWHSSAGNVEMSCFDPASNVALEASARAAAAESGSVHKGIGQDIQGVVGAAPGQRVVRSTDKKERVLDHGFDVQVVFLRQCADFSHEEVQLTGPAIAAAIHPSSRLPAARSFFGRG